MSYPKNFDVVGYVFDADQYCPACMVAMLPTGPGQRFDGWALAPGARPMDPRENIDEIAHAFGFTDESTYDSSEFPKVIFRDSVTSDDYCSTCHELLED